LGEAVEQPRHRVGPLEQRVALARLGGLQLDQSFLLEVAERADDPVALLAERGRRLVRADRRPDARRLAARDEAAQEVGAGRVEAGEGLLEGAAPRAHAVARV